MSLPEHLNKFSQDQMSLVSQAVDVAEDMVSDYYKLSATQMRKLNYDVKTVADLDPSEIVADHFAQIVRYRAEKTGSLLNTSSEDFYKICIQDHSILKVLKNCPWLGMYPFLIYVICHELVHVVRFQRFEQHFHVPDDQKQNEEIRVHQITHQILSRQHINAIEPVFEFYENWRIAADGNVQQ
jgi:hypothetical protein